MATCVVGARAPRRLVGRDRLRRVPRLPGPAPATRGRRGRRLVHAVHRRARPRPAVRGRAGALARASGSGCSRAIGSCWRGAATSEAPSSSRSPRRSRSRRSCGSTTSRCSLVVVALAQPRLGIVWFVPLGMVVTPGSGHPTPFETAWTLAVAALTVALALRASRGERTAERSRSGASERAEP